MNRLPLLLLAVVCAALAPGAARAQLTATVVATCGTPPLTNVAGRVALLTIDVNGNLCMNAAAGGGGAVTVADGADVALGAVGDAAWSGTGNATVVAALKSIRALLAGTVTVSGTVTANLGTIGGAATAANQTTELAALAAIQAAVQGATPAGANDIGNVGGRANVTPTDCSSTITTGGTAQNAFTAQAALRGMQIQNLDTTEGMWVSFTGTAAASTAGSYFLAPASATTMGGTYNTPSGFGFNTALSVIAATTGHKFSCTRW